VLDKQSKIVGFQEKPSPEECRSNLINTGLYVLEPTVLDLIPTGKPFDFARDVFPIILNQRKRLYGYKTKGFWTDIGSVEGFLEASWWLLNKMTRHISPNVDISQARVKGPVWIGEGTTLGMGVTIRGPAYVEDSCTIRKNASLNPGTTLKRRVSVGEDSKINGALVFDSSEIHSNVTVNRCIIDERCEIKSNSVIDALAMLGAGCKIGERVIIDRGVKLEPGLVVEQGKTIKT
jgi:NDP-sugar pyrophosphorylase family protein